MSLTSYRAAPPRGEVLVVLVRKEGGSWSGLAVTYSPASWDAVPSAAVRLTAEFGMGSGVSRSLWPPDRIRAPASLPPLGGVAMQTSGVPSQAQLAWVVHASGSWDGVSARHWIGSSLSDD